MFQLFKKSGASPSSRYASAVATAISAEAIPASNRTGRAVPAEAALATVEAADRGTAARALRVLVLPVPAGVARADAAARPPDSVPDRRARAVAGSAQDRLRARDLNPFTW